MSADYLFNELTTLQSFINYWKSKGMTLDKALAMIELEELLNDEENFPRSIEVYKKNICDCIYDNLIATLIDITIDIITIFLGKFFAFLFISSIDIDLLFPDEYCNCEGKGYTNDFDHEEENELYNDIMKLITDLPCDPSEYIKTHYTIVTLKEINNEYYT